MFSRKYSVLLTAAASILFVAAAAHAADQPSTSITPEPIDVEVVPLLEGDYNFNCEVEFGDLSAVLSGFIPNGRYGMYELELVLLNFGAVCGGAVPGDDKSIPDGSDDSAAVTPE